MTPEEFALVQAAMNSPPEDKTPLLVLADWYDDHSEPHLAYACRWMAYKGKRPRLREVDYLCGFDWRLEDDGYNRASSIPRTIYYAIIEEYDARSRTGKELAWRELLFLLATGLKYALNNCTWEVSAEESQ